VRRNRVVGQITCNNPSNLIALMPEHVCRNLLKDAFIRLKILCQTGGL
jgi:hypothetical protein